MEEDTPRTVIQGLINAADTNETDRPVRKRKRLTRTPDMDSRLSRSLPSTEIRLYQQDEASPHHSVVEKSTSMRKTSTRNKRESLVDTVRRKRFKFRRSELFQSESHTDSSLNDQHKNSLGTGEPRRKSPRIANLSKNQSSAIDDSHLSAKTNSRRQRPQDSTKSPNLKQTSSLRLSPRKRMTPTVMRSPPRMQPTSAHEPRSSPRIQPTSAQEPRSSPRIHPTSAQEPRSSPRIHPTSAQEPRFPPRMQPASAQKPRSSPRIQPTSDKEQQDLSYVEYDTMKSSPRGRKQLDVVKVNSVSEMGNQNWSPNGKQSAVNVREEENSRLTSKIMPVSPNTSMHSNEENSSFSMGLSKQRKQVEMYDVNQSTTKSPSNGLKRSRGGYLMQTPDKSNSQNSQYRTPNRSLSSVDFNRVKQSASKISTQSRVGTPSKINRSLIQQRSMATTSLMENAATRTPPPSSVQNPRNSISPILGIANKEAVRTPVFEHTALAPRHSSPLSRTHHISMTRDQNLPDLSMIERSERTYFQDDLDRSELFQLRTPHLGPVRPHIPTPSDTPAPAIVTHPVKQKPVIKPKIVKKPKVKVQSSTIPAAVIKQTFSHFCKMRVDKDTLPELVKITDKYFDRVAHDLETFAHHAGRKTIDERDVELLLKRQKFITKKTSLTHLVEKHLPLELRQEIIPMARSGNKIFPKL